MKVYKLSDSESKTLLEIADNFIAKKEIPNNYDMDKIEDVNNYVYDNFR